MMKQKINKIVKKHNKKIIILFFVILYIFGLFFISNGGFYNDEVSEKNILRMNIYDISRNINAHGDIAKYYEDNNFKPISQSVEKDHGIAVYYLYTPLLAIEKVSGNLGSLSWHLYTYTLYFLGVICMYLLSKMLFKKKTVALLTTLIFFFTPRMLIDGMCNNKDSVLLSFTIISLYFGIKFIKNKDYKSAIIFGLVSAFTCNLKISGAFVFCIIGLFYLIDLTIHKKWSFKTIKSGLLAIVCCAGLYILITPAIWGSGFHLISYIDWCLSNSTHFSRWSGNVLFEGIHYDTKVTSLPWYYLPKFIVITTPIYILVLILISFVLFIKKTLKDKKIKKLDLNYLLILSIPVITVFIAMISHPNIYNGWRHFYFLYGPMVLLAGYALYYISKTKHEFKFNIIVSIFILINAVIICIYGVFCTCYFNVLAGMNAHKKYELNYYSIATKTAVQKIVNNCHNEKCYVAAEGYAREQIRLNLLGSTNENKEKIELVSKEEGNKLSKNKKKVFYYVDTAYDFTSYKNYKLFYEAKILGSTIYYIYTK